MRFRRIQPALTLLVLSSALQTVAQEETEILVGRSSAAKLVVDTDFPQPVELPPSVFPTISGYVTSFMGIHSTILDDVTNDFFQLSPAADVQFILLAKDPGMEVWNDSGSAFMNVGETFAIGSAPFDTHPLWNLVTGVVGNAYSLSLKLHDLNGIYSDSDPFTLSFTPEPPPRYSINLTPVDAQHAALSWPTNAASWVLQSADSLTATNWDTITNVPAVNGTNFSLSISANRPQQFFRLLKN
jgi:hypothetical protein